MLQKKSCFFLQFLITFKNLNWNRLQRAFREKYNKMRIWACPLLKSISVFVTSTEKRERVVGIKSLVEVWRPLNRGRNGPIPTCRSRLYDSYIYITLHVHILYLIILYYNTIVWSWLVASSRVLALASFCLVLLLSHLVSANLSRS